MLVVLVVLFFRSVAPGALVQHPASWKGRATDGEESVYDDCVSAEAYLGAAGSRPEREGQEERREGQGEEEGQTDEEDEEECGRDQDREGDGFVGVVFVFERSDADHAVFPRVSVDAVDGDVAATDA